MYARLGHDDEGQAFFCANGLVGAMAILFGMVEPLGRISGSNTFIGLPVSDKK
jgi:hypothetical protein